MSRTTASGFPSDLQPPPRTGAAPRPFTGDMIRSGMPSGAMRRFVTEGLAGTRATVVWTVVRATPTECTIRFTFLDADGARVGAPTERTTRWDELANHATFPLEATEVVSHEVRLPAGTFDCWVYTVTERSHTDVLVATYSFAKELPGAPIKYSSLRNGTSEGVTYLEAYSQST